MKQFLKATALVAVTLVMGFTIQSCSAVKPVDKSKLAGHWVLEELKGEKVSEIHKGPAPTIEFNFEKNMINGSAGCNSYFGGFTLDEKNVFTPSNLGSTLMACVDMAIEDNFLKTLGKPGLTLVLSENAEIFALQSDAKNVLLFKKGEKVSYDPKKITAENLSGDWKLDRMRDGDVEALFGTQVPVMNINAEGKISGTSGCNRFNTSYTIDNEVVKVGLAMGTRMACPHLEGEAKFLTLIEGEFSALIVGNKLSLSKDGSIAFEFLKYTAE